MSLDVTSAGVTYYHVMLSRHEVLLADGAPCESLYLGLQTINSIPPALLEDLLTALGLSRHDLARLRGMSVPARPVVQGRLARKLVVRHVQHRRPLVGHGGEAHLPSAQPELQSD